MDAESLRSEDPAVDSVYDQVVDHRVGPVRDHDGCWMRSLCSAEKVWSKCNVPLEPSPLRVEVVDQREDDEDVAQHAQATSEAAEYPGRGEAEVCDVVVVPAAVTSSR